MKTASRTGKLPAGDSERMTEGQGHLGAGGRVPLSGRRIRMQLIYPGECHAIRGAVYEVYSTLGPGFAEDVYQEALEIELAERGIPFVAQPRVRIQYKGRVLDKVYVPDLACYGKIVVELKAVRHLLPEHLAQVINYLQATGMLLGMLVNFGAYPRVEIETPVNKRVLRGMENNESRFADRETPGQGTMKRMKRSGNHFLTPEAFSSLRSRFHCLEWGNSESRFADRETPGQGTMKRMKRMVDASNVAGGVAGQVPWFVAGGTR